jgi:hypothetical protein
MLLALLAPSGAYAQTLPQASPSATPLIDITIGQPTPSPSPAPSASAKPPRHLAAAYHTDELMGGTWQCTTFAGTKLTHVFSRSDDATSILVETQFTLAGGQVAQTRETYHHHVDTATWTAVLADGTIVAKAPEWSGETWAFTGISAESGKAVRFRMLYTRFASDAFRRDFQRFEAGGTWADYAGETCQRGP